MASPIADSYAALSGSTIYAGRYAAGVPAWIGSATTFQWVQAPSTRIRDDLLYVNPAYTALLTIAAGGGYLGDSGGAFRQASSEIILGASGGGTGSWPGTDIIGLSLDANFPAWQIRVPSVDISEIWPNNSGAINRPFTVDLFTNKITVSATQNGFSNGEACTFPIGTPPAPFVVGTTYYVVNAVGYSPAIFQLSATLGGAAIVMTDVGTGAARIHWTPAPHAWTRSNIRAAGHTYNQSHFIDQTDELVLTGHTQNWELDYGIYPDVGSWKYGNSQWDPKGTYPNVWSGAPTQDTSWQAQDFTTGTIFTSINDDFVVRTPGNGLRPTPSGSTLFRQSLSPPYGAGHDKALAFYDPVRATLIWYGITNDTTWGWKEISASNGTYRAFNLIGPAAASWRAGVNMLAYCRDPVSGVYYMYQDDGVLYRLDWSGGDLSLSVVATVGTAPPVDASGPQNVGGPWVGMFNRMWYSSKLGGLVLLISPVHNVYFIRLR